MVLPSGHRRFKLDDCLFFFEGVSVADLEEERGGNGIAIYVRVSSESQDKAGSLKRQEARLLEQVSTLEECPQSEIRTYRDVCSSFSQREGLERLLSDMLDGKGIRKIYVENFNRWSRVPAMTKVLEFLARRAGVELVALDLSEEKDPDSLQADVRELVDFVTVLACRSASRKSKLVTVKGLQQETIARMVELRKANTPLKEITRILKEEGHKTSHGDHLSYFLVKSRLDSNGTESLLTVVTGGKAEKRQSPFVEFRRNHLVQKENGRTPVPQVIAAYKRWATSRGFKTEDDSSIGRMMKDIKRIKGKFHRDLLGVVLHGV